MGKLSLKIIIKNKSFCFFCWFFCIFGFWCFCLLLLLLFSIFYSLVIFFSRALSSFGLCLFFFLLFYFHSNFLWNHLINTLSFNSQFIIKSVYSLRPISHIVINFYTYLAQKLWIALNFSFTIFTKIFQCFKLFST